MSAVEFDRARPRLRQFAESNLRIARAVLVGGLGTTAAAVRFHTSRQRVHGIVHRVKAAIRQVPSHWRRIEVWLPPRLADRVKAMARQARIEWLRRKAAKEARRAARTGRRGS
jgi:hypothetical protein